MQNDPLLKGLLAPNKIKYKYSISSKNVKLYEQKGVE